MSAVVAEGAGHVPVLLAEVVAALGAGQGRLIVDGTLGGGSYARAFLAAGARVVGFDRDPRAVAALASLVAASQGRLRLVCASFSAMARELPAASVDGVALDLGISSIQLEDPAYGLSFRRDGPLDMRLGGEGATAADLVNDRPEGEIVEILRRYGEEPAARRIARAIVARRPLRTTGQLAAAVHAAVGGPAGRPRDPATRTFQALRIAVNNELGELDRGLEAAAGVLAPGGRLAVVSFHSLEDRLVKQWMAARAEGRPGGSRHLPPRAAPAVPPLFGRPARAQRPGAAEIAANPRARSATLRVVERRAA